MKVITCENGVWDVKEIQNELQPMKDIIGCHTIQHLGGLPFWGVTASIWCDDDGKLGHSKQDTITGFFVREGRIIDCLNGNLVVTGLDYAKEDCCSLTSKQLVAVLDSLMESSIFDDEVLQALKSMSRAYSDKDWKIAHKLLVIVL